MAKAKKAKAKKKSTKKRARRKVPRQKQITGTERQKFPDLSEAAEVYEELKVSRMDLGREELEAKAKLMKLMQEHELESYVDDELQLEVFLEHGAVNVKVKKRTKTKPEFDDDLSDVEWIPF